MFFHTEYHNAAMNIFALMQLVSLPGAGAAAVYAGAVLFFVSDCSLFILCFGGKERRNVLNFTVMLTYILGQFLISHGMILIQNRLTERTNRKTTDVYMNKSEKNNIEILKRENIAELIFFSISLTICRQMITED